MGNDLRSAETAVKHEVFASRAVWLLIANGLPRTLPKSLQRAVAAASAAAKALPEPPFMKNPGRLTGPAAGIAGAYENYARLSERGWRLIEASIPAIATGASTVANFERKNSTLYIDAIYDSHFNLSLLGKSLMSGYEQLGGAAAFGATLTPSALSTLTVAYSIPTVRLEPHPAGSAKEG